MTDSSGVAFHRRIRVTCRPAGRPADCAGSRPSHHVVSRLRRGRQSPMRVRGRAPARYRRSRVYRVWSSISNAGPTHISADDPNMCQHVPCHQVTTRACTPMRLSCKTVISIQQERSRTGIVKLRLPSAITVPRDWGDWSVQKPRLVAHRMRSGAPSHAPAHRLNLGVIACIGTRDEWSTVADGTPVPSNRQLARCAPVKATCSPRKSSASTSRSWSKSMHAQFGKAYPSITPASRPCQARVAGCSAGCWRFGRVYRLVSSSRKTYNARLVRTEGSDGHWHWRAG